MYALLMAECTVMAYMLYKMLCERNITKRRMLGLYVIILFGGLTHYYFYIYSFFTALFVGIALIVMKFGLKKIMAYIATWMLGIGSCFAIFPAAVQHMFFGYRSDDLKGNINGDFSQVFTYSLQCLQWIFSKWELILFAALCICALVICRKRKHKWELWIILAANLVASLVIMKVTVWITYYYICPIYPMTALATTMLWMEVKDIAKKWMCLIETVFLLLGSLNLYQDCLKPVYAEAKSYEQAMEPIRVLGKADCYYIQQYDEWQQILWGKIGELAEYDEVCVQREPRFDLNYMNLVMGDRITKDPVVIMVREEFWKTKSELQTERFIKLTSWGGWVYLLYEGM